MYVGHKMYVGIKQRWIFKLSFVNWVSAFRRSKSGPHIFLKRHFDPFCRLWRRGCPTSWNGLNCPSESEKHWVIFLFEFFFKVVWFLQFLKRVRKACVHPSRLWWWNDILSFFWGVEVESKQTTKCLQSSSVQFGGAICSIMQRLRYGKIRPAAQFHKMEGTIPQKCTVVASSPTSSSGNSIQDCFVTSLYLAQSGHPILRPGFIAWFCISKIDLP